MGELDSAYGSASMLPFSGEYSGKMPKAVVRSGERALLTDAYFQKSKQEEKVRWEAHSRRLYACNTDR